MAHSASRGSFLDGVAASDVSASALLVAKSHRFSSTAVSDSLQLHAPIAQSRVAPRNGRHAAHSDSRAAVNRDAGGSDASAPSGDLPAAYMSGSEATGSSDQWRSVEQWRSVCAQEAASVASGHYEMRRVESIAVSDGPVPHSSTAAARGHTVELQDSAVDSILTRELDDTSAFASGRPVGHSAQLAGYGGAAMGAGARSGDRHESSDSALASPANGAHGRDKCSGARGCAGCGSSRCAFW